MAAGTIIIHARMLTKISYPGKSGYLKTTTKTSFGTVKSGQIPAPLPDLMSAAAGKPLK